MAPSARYNRERGRRHKKLTDWGRQWRLQVRRWLPERAIVAVADSGDAALTLPGRCRRLRRPITVVTRLRPDAALYAPAPPRRPPIRFVVSHSPRPPPASYRLFSQTAIPFPPLAPLPIIPPATSTAVIMPIVFCASLPPCPSEKAAAENLSALEYMRKYGAYELEKTSYNKHLTPLSESELDGAE